MNPRAMLAVAYATGRASHARQVEGDNKKKKEVEGAINLCALANNETCEEKLVARGDASCLSPSDTLKQKYIKFPSTDLLI
jgi:putative hemolysin